MHRRRGGGGGGGVGIIVAADEWRSVGVAEVLKLASTVAEGDRFCCPSLVAMQREGRSRRRSPGAGAARACTTRRQ